MSQQNDKTMIIHDKDLIKNLDCSDSLVFQVSSRKRSLILNWFFVSGSIFHCGKERYFENP